MLKAVDTRFVERRSYGQTTARLAGTHTPPAAEPGSVPRRYEPGDAAALWELKRAFELELGAGTGGGDKRARYEAKLTSDYRDRYLDWVDSCREEEPGCLWVADLDADAHADADSGPAADDSGPAGYDSSDSHDSPDKAGDPARDLAGYAFLLPESLAMIWDAAVLNEIYVRPTARGTGLADDLLAAVVEHAREQTLPLDRMVLDVDPGNGRACQFYGRHGFESWGEMVAREL